MKTLIVLGVGVALGFSFKKTTKIKKPKIVMVDNQNSLSEYLFGDNAKEAFKKHLKIARSDL